MSGCRPGFRSTSRSASTAASGWRDKAGSILRVETTVAETQPFKVLRPKEPRDDDRPDAKLTWLPLRKGVADLHRRAQVSQRANDNYLTALAAVHDTTPLADVFDQVARRVTHDGRSARAIRIGDPTEIALLKAVARGEFATAGFRNRDLQRLLYPVRREATRVAQRRVSAKVGRMIRLLRAHGLVRKVQRSHRYTLTNKGHQLAAAIFAMRTATTQQLLRQAA